MNPAGIGYSSTLTEGSVMTGRRHTTKTAIALWVLIVLVDLVVLVTAVGVLVMVLALAGALVIASTVVWMRWKGHRPRPGDLPGTTTMSTLTVPRPATSPESVAPPVVEAADEPLAAGKPIADAPGTGNARPV